jgi:shikimate kinase
MMGTGKSYWAQKISDSHNMEWVDLDAQIEKDTSMTIKEIFETQGEVYFRSKETEVLHKMTEFGNIVIATGGGTPCFHDNMKWMNDHGITIWIDEPIETLAERLKKEKAHRPLIKDLNDEELLHFLSIKLSERSKFYNQCQHHLQGNNISDRSFAKIIQQHA